jgi:TonB family protein
LEIFLVGNNTTIEFDAGILRFFRTHGETLMVPVIALLLVLLVPQVATPAAPQTSELPSAQTAQQPSPSNGGAEQAAASAQLKPNPDASGKYHIGDGVTSPTVRHQVAPKFSHEARKSKISGIALVNLIVDVNGKPTNVHIIRSMADQVDKQQLAAALSLDQAAVDAVRKYKFAPATFQGKPVPLELNIEVNFQVF